MKRTILFRVISIGLFLIYLSITIINIENDYIFLNEHWFSNLLVIMGVIFFTRFLIYKIDSSLFLGCLLFNFGVCGIINYYINQPIIFFVGIYLLGISLASLTIFIFFRQYFHFKIFVFFSICAILLMLYSKKLIPLVAFITLISLILITVLVLIINLIKSNTRKV